MKLPFNKIKKRTVVLQSSKTDSDPDRRKDF